MLNVCLDAFVSTVYNALPFQGTLEMKNEKIIRLLLEMLELDSSEYVRLMVSLSQDYYQNITHSMFSGL